MKRWISPFMMQDCSSCLVQRRILTAVVEIAREIQRKPPGVKGKSLILDTSSFLATVLFTLCFTKVNKSERQLGTRMPPFLLA